VTRTGGSAGELLVRVLAGGEGDTATTADYSFQMTEAPDVLSWSDGDMATKTLNIDIVADSLVEGDETLTLTLQDLPLGQSEGTKKNAAAERVGNVQANAIGSLSHGNVNHQGLNDRPAGGGSDQGHFRQ